MECYARRLLMSAFLEQRCTRWTYGLKLAVLIIQLSLTFSALLSKPMNTIAVFGNRVKMKCSIYPPVLYPVDWEFSAAGSNDFSYIYTSKRITENLTSRYKIDTDNRTRYDIVIDSVDLSHAGTYTCIVGSTRASAELTVLGFDPVCNTNALNGAILEGGYIRMWCIVNYAGSLIPAMVWTRNDGEAIDADIAHTDTSTTVTSLLRKQLDWSDNGITFTCKTSFKPTSAKTGTSRTTGNGHATNVPHYQHLWDFKRHVLCFTLSPLATTVTRILASLTNRISTRSFQLTATFQKCTKKSYRTVTYKDMSWFMKSVYEVGDHLVCSANGNPTPTYEWMETETDRTIHGSILTIDDQMRSDKNHSFSCTAYNTVAGIKRQTAETITFTVKGAQALSKAAVIMLTVAGLVAVIGLVALGFSVALTMKACTKKNLVNRGSSDETSIQHKDNEMVTESNIQSGESEHPPLNQSTSHEGDLEDHSAEDIACEGYSSLKRSASAILALPTVYAKLHLYENLDSNQPPATE